MAKTQVSGATGVSEDVVQGYRRDGFGSLDALVDASDLQVLAEAYDHVLASDWPGSRQLGGITRQVMWPAAVDPVFDDNPALRAGMAIARRLLGVEDVRRTFDMLIFKPARHPHATPWHQDASYARTPFTSAGFTIPLDTVQFWVAVDPADVENGCMHFLPGQHQRPLLEHHVASGDPADESRLLAVRDPEAVLDLAAAVAVPLAAGGCTFHSYGTPHYTPPNRSADRPRRAYIFNIATERALRQLLG
jgi:hypothetical protein